MTAFGQEYITITRDEQRQCVQWYSELQYKDSIISEKDSIIDYGNTILNIERRNKEAISDTLNVVRLDNYNLQKKVVRNRRIAIGSFTGLVAVILISIKPK